VVAIGIVDPVEGRALATRQVFSDAMVVEAVVDHQGRDIAFEALGDGSLPRFQVGREQPADGSEPQKDDRGDPRIADSEAHLCLALAGACTHRTLPEGRWPESVLSDVIFR